MTMTEAENRLAAFVSAAAGNNAVPVYCGKLPPGVREGATVNIVSRAVDVEGALQSCTAEIVFTFFERAEMLAAAEAFASALPDYGGSFASLLPEGGITFREETCGGVFVCRGTIRVEASFV